MLRQVIVYPGEDGYWVAECPSLPGCISQGETRSRVIANIREAIQGYIAALEENRLPVPKKGATLSFAAMTHSDRSWCLITESLTAERYERSFRRAD